MTASTEQAWLCTVCGYVHRNSNTPPKSCPVCGAPASDFEPYIEPQATTAPAPKQWRCRNCNYVHNGGEPPETCPLCGVGPDEFEPVADPPEAGLTDSTMKVVVVGGGIAGVAAAEAVREHAPRAEIHLLSAEARTPYYRLNLTRYLAGEIELDSLPIHPDAWYQSSNISLRTGAAVTSVTTESSAVTMADGSTMPYDGLVLATGSHAFVPPIPGSDRRGVMTLRTADDADQILAMARECGECHVVGGGILGVETAGALARRDIKVTLIESHDWLMPRQLNSKAADRIEAHLNKLGISLMKQARTSSFEGAESVTGIVFEGGTRIATSLVVLATGVRPNTSLARKTSLEVNRGIVVDNHMRTSATAVYAAGDAAEHNGQLYGTWAPSQYQGRIAGLNAAGIVTEFGGMPRANSLKILGLDFLSVGQFEPEDGSYIVLDHQDDDGFAHFVFRDGKMTGSILIGHAGIAGKVKQSVEAGSDFSGLLGSGPSGADILSRLRET